MLVSLYRVRTIVLSAAALLAMSGAAPALADDHGHGAPASKPAATKPTMKPATKAASTPAKPDAHGANPKTTPAEAHDEPDKSSPTEHEPAAMNTGSSMETKPSSPSASTEVPESPTPELSLKLLQEGNARWVSGASQDPNIDSARRAMLADKGQKPFVTVLTCADSRLPVERIFDRGVGEIFTIRVAGNVAGTSETGTIEYGVGHLKTPLLVVMGHTKCGAVAAAASKAELHGAIGELVAGITPAVDRARRNNPEADEKQIAALAVRENVWQSVFTLVRTSAELRKAIGSGEVKVVGAICDISTGKVEFLGEHPWQTELVDAMNARAKSHANDTAQVETTKDEHGH